MSKKRLLDRVEIPNPCFADWERMVGSEQIRFCEECNKHVYNLSAMPRGEAEALIASAPKGRLCARLTRDAEGITMTADDQPGVQLLWRRASPIANAVVSAILTMATPGVAGASQFETQRASITSAIARTEGSQDSQGAGAVLSGTLFDPQRAVIAGGKVELVNEDTGDVQTTTSSDSGSFQFVVSSDSLYTLKAAANGFASVTTSGLRQGQHIDIKLPVAVMTMGGAIAFPVHPLRELYNDSDRIVVARAVRMVKVSGSPFGRTSLSVSSTLKGEGSEPLVNVYHYAFNDQQGPFTAGEDLLVFLKRGRTNSDLKSVSGYELVDQRLGIKRLSTTELDVYNQRINELAQLAHRETPSKEDLVEWLVRCAEDPVTRWEGAFELASSAANLRASCTQDDSDEETDSPEEAEEAEGDEPIEVDAAQQFAPGAEELRDAATFAVLLTGDQKERLMKALLSTDEITDGDESLIDCVKDFRDPRLLPFLVSQLRRSQDNPPESATHIVQVIAELVADKRVDALAKSYRDAPYDDEDEDEDEENETADQGPTKTQLVMARERSAQLRLFLQQVDRITRGRNLKPVTP